MDPLYTEFALGEISTWAGSGRKILLYANKTGGCILHLVYGRLYPERDKWTCKYKGNPMSHTLVRFYTLWCCGLSI